MDTIKMPITLEYDPKPKKGKPEKMFKSWWLIGATDCDVSEYYAWFLRKRTGIVLQEPAWGAHVSVVRGEIPPNQDVWNKHQGKVIDVTLEVDVRTNGGHWWLRATCEELKDIREELGLYRHGKPFEDGGHMGLHLTLGNPIPLHKEISRYYHRVFTMF